MPNYVRLRVSAPNIPLLHQMLIEDGHVDFKKVIPIPPDLRNSSGSMSYDNDPDMARRLKAYYSDNISQDEFVKRVGNNLDLHCDITHYKTELWEDYVAGYFNQQRYGYIDHIEFTNGKWGTTSVSDTRILPSGEIVFETARTLPKPILEKLAETQPIRVMFANEARNFPNGIIDLYPHKDRVKIRTVMQESNRLQKAVWSEFYANEESFQDIEQMMDPVTVAQRYGLPCIKKEIDMENIRTSVNEKGNGLSEVMEYMKQMDGKEFLFRTSEMQDGILHGKQKEYRPDGSPAAFRQFKEGQLHGQQIEWVGENLRVAVYKDGNLASERFMTPEDVAKKKAELLEPRQFGKKNEWNGTTPEGVKVYEPALDITANQIPDGEQPFREAMEEFTQKVSFLVDTYHGYRNKGDYYKNGSLDEIRKYGGICHEFSPSDTEQKKPRPMFLFSKRIEGRTVTVGIDIPREGDKYNPGIAYRKIESQKLIDNNRYQTLTVEENYNFGHRLSSLKKDLPTGKSYIEKKWNPEGKLFWHREMFRKGKILHDYIHPSLKDRICNRLTGKGPKL